MKLRQLELNQLKRANKQQKRIDTVLLRGLARLFREPAVPKRMPLVPAVFEVDVRYMEYEEEYDVSDFELSF